MIERSSERIGLALAIPLVVAGLWSAPPAVAQQQAAMEEIIVTARQREEALQDVPASITVFTAADYQNGIVAQGRLEELLLSQFTQRNGQARASGLPG